MEEYIRFINRKNRKSALCLLLICTACFFAFTAVAYCNTRFNGFADVPPAAYYFEKIGAWWNRLCRMLFAFENRFINFFK